MTPKRPVDYFKIKKISAKLHVQLMDTKHYFHTVVETKVGLIQPIGMVGVREPYPLTIPAELGSGYPVILDDGELIIEMIEGTQITMPFLSSTHNRFLVERSAFWWNLKLTPEEFEDKLFALYGRQWFSINKRNMLGME